MLSPSAQSFPIVDHAKWLKLFGSWNAKRTRATTSIFDIPNDLLCDRLKNEIMTVPTTTSCLDTQQELEEKGRTCRACNLVFTGLYEQQQHFKTELHRMNLKQKLAGLESLVEIPADYHDVTSSGSSITGVKGVRFADVKGADESSSDEEEDLDFIYSEADYFEEAVQQDTAVGRYPTEYITNEGKARRFISKQDGPQYIFSSSRESLSPWDFTVSVGVLHEASSVSSFEVQPWTLLSEAVQKLQENNGSMWCVLILRSGRFAGAVFDRETVLTHKVLRRYTVRAKAGGSQSSHDGQGKNAKSVGAMLRRYGEQALTEDVRALLKDWGAYIQSCSSIFLSCPKTMRSVIFEDGGKDVPIRRNDPRVRLVPFMVKKPTFEEVRLVHSRLSAVSFQPRETLDLSVLDDPSGSKSISSIIGFHESNPTDFTNKKVQTSHTPDPELPFCIASTRLFAACASGDANSVVTILSEISSGKDQDKDKDKDNNFCDISSGNSNSEHVLDTVLQEQWDMSEILNMPNSLESLATCLHIASESGFESIVKLLLGAGADPTRSDVRGRPPYFLAKTKEVRDAFRRARAGTEDTFAWDAAGVPAALTEDMEKAQRDKEKEKKKRSKIKKKEKDEKDAEETKRAAVTRCEQIAAASEEASNKRASAGLCAQCAKSLFGIKSLDVFDRRCCSSPCVLLLRRQLAAQAAEKRFTAPV